MIRRKLLILANVVVLGLMAMHLHDSYQVNRFAGVGGPEEYRRQKYEQLERLRGKLAHLPEEARRLEERRIDDQIAEMEAGLPTVELGKELRRLK
jgi:hypothetical protein